MRPTRPLYTPEVVKTAERLEISLYGVLLGTLQVLFGTPQVTSRI